jgi:hypothetical protein
MASKTFRIVRAFAVAASCALGACATTPRVDAKAEAETRAAAASVAIYDSTQISPVNYRVIKRFWIDTWRTAFWLPMHANEEEGIASLKADAARLGANALLNVSCRRDTDFIPIMARSGVVCSGDAIKVL